MLPNITGSVFTVRDIACRHGELNSNPVDEAIEYYGFAEKIYSKA